MRQIAALPYRPASDALDASGDASGDASVEVLLVTSRRTGRWVVPKGNPMKGLSRHAAAAQEALEEAGVRGAIHPAPFGSYRVLKQLPTGLTQWLDVDLFALAVTAQLDSWPEQAQRIRRWFTLAQAADAVAEPDLQDLIRGFDSAAIRDTAKAGAPSKRRARL